MRTSEGFVFAGTEAGFRRYVKCYMTYFSINKDRYKYRYDLTTTDINEEMEFNKFALLNKEFTNLLTKKEREAVEYLSYHDKYTDEPQNLNDLLSSAYKKWLVIFFNKSNPIFGTISSEIIGSELECLLINSKTKKTELARMLGVDRTTVVAICEGKRLPSLDFIYKISVIFKISIDELVGMAIIK